VIDGNGNDFSGSWIWGETVEPLSEHLEEPENHRNEIQNDPLKTSLTSIAKNARSLLSDAELLFDHGRYARAAALAVLAVEEVGKFYLLKWNKVEAQQAMRYHPPKQRIVAFSVMAEAAFDAYERTLHSLGLDWKAIEDVTLAEQKWLDSQGGWDKFSERLKSDTPIIDNMAKAFNDVSQYGLVRETLAGTLSTWKERGLYVDVSRVRTHKPVERTGIPKIPRI
jgi:AbiV family abortive infection protein